MPTVRIPSLSVTMRFPDTDSRSEVAELVSALVTNGRAMVFGGETRTPQVVNFGLATTAEVYDEEPGEGDIVEAPGWVTVFSSVLDLRRRL